MAFPDYLHFKKSPQQILDEIISKSSLDKVAILVDENTKKHCLPFLNFEKFNVIQIASGERNKNLSTCEFIWDQMTKLGMSRQSVLINLGGGVIGDMGGFAASTYKRGIPTINIPTTLLSMVDASIGGKLGVDFQGLKNHIGLFKDPMAVIIVPDFLKTLPQNQLTSGFAEILKHALISDLDYWKNVSQLNIDTADWSHIIEQSISIKNTVVNEDPNENGRRKILNFGHTFGHAIESYFFESDQPLLHGEAIAIGMVLESHISMQLGWINENELEEIKNVVKKYFQFPKLPPIEQVVAFLRQDKKNQQDLLLFSLIEGLGKCKYDIKVELPALRLALNYYKKIR